MFLLNITERRAAIGFSSGLIRIVTINSGRIVSEIERGHMDGGCTCLSFFEYQGSRRLIAQQAKNRLFYLMKHLDLRCSMQRI